MPNFPIDPKGWSQLVTKPKTQEPWSLATAGESPVGFLGTLDPNQQALADALSGMLSGVQSPQDFLSGLTQFTSGQNAFQGPGGSDVLAAIQNALKGGVSEEYFQSTIAGPARKQWEEVGRPRVAEEFVGPGTYWGTARGQAVERGRQAVEGDIAATRGTMANEALNRALQAALGYGGMMSQNLGNWIQAYMAAHPSQADTIQAILQYLQTPTQIAFQDPEYIPGAIQSAMGGRVGAWR